MNERLHSLEFSQLKDGLSIVKSRAAATLKVNHVNDSLIKSFLSQLTEVKYEQYV